MRGRWCTDEEGCTERRWTLNDVGGDRAHLSSNSRYCPLKYGLQIIIKCGREKHGVPI